MSKGRASGHVVPARTRRTARRARSERCDRADGAQWPRRSHWTGRWNGFSGAAWSDWPGRCDGAPRIDGCRWTARACRPGWAARSDWPAGCDRASRIDGCRWTARACRPGWAARSDWPGGCDRAFGTDGCRRTARTCRPARCSRASGRFARDGRAGHIGRQRRSEHDGHRHRQLSSGHSCSWWRRARHDDGRAKGTGAARRLVSERRRNLDRNRRGRHRRAWRWPDDDSDGIRALQPVGVPPFTDRVDHPDTFAAPSVEAGAPGFTRGCGLRPLLTMSPEAANWRHRRPRRNPWLR
jgi:hypothetical protein